MLCKDRLDIVTQAISTLDVYKAQASVEEDRVRILEQIEKMEGGGRRMNQILQEKIREGVDNLMKMVARVELRIRRGQGKKSRD